MNLDIWPAIYDEVKNKRDSEPRLKTFFDASVLHHSSLGEALAHILAPKIASANLTEPAVKSIALEAIKADPSIPQAAAADLRANKLRDPACTEYALPAVILQRVSSLTSPPPSPLSLERKALLLSYVFSKPHQ